MDTMTPPTSWSPRVVPSHEETSALEQLQEGLCDGKPAAMATLYRQFGSQINRLVWRLLGADAEHDDVVQQAFLNVIQSIHTLRDPRKLRTWVASVTVNTVRKEIRARRVRRNVVAVGADPVAGKTACSHPEKALAVKRFYEVLSLLRTDERIVLTLHIVEGLTVSDTAEAMRVSPATAKRRLRRARAAFMKRAARDPVLASWVEELSHAG